ncbi:Sulfhydryl oxidase 1 [Hibiscus syriacus]|uniref:Sulfhydryl oxidase n=1 Tax=Hibiscus syriacus TaxID=106335 RepID=A0A6A3CU76_HIBSY|nr:sulfhydryl oxidase 2-like isoform X2 [Hibiscus syriacus]KAE8732067.1 Sulfhydryl oxidase 1 [Hibiscus syriacus]
MSHVFWILILTLSISKATSLQAGTRTVLRVIDDNNGGGGVDPKVYGVELNATNFDGVLKDTPVTHAIVEFFAHWCPACRNYKPHYEKVARLFNGPDAVHHGIILMTRVDCALKINTDLCDKFSVGHYPMLFWGPPKKFSSGWKPNQEKSEIREIDDGRTAERLLNWINKQLDSSYGLDDENFENELLPSNISDPGPIARAIYDVEEATATAFDIILEHKMIKSKTRASLIKFLQLLVAHHPSRRCRKGSAEVLVNFDELCPLDMWSSDKVDAVANNLKEVLHDFQICGKEVPRGYWMFCRGSKNETRGFSCGLWVLMHSLSVRIGDEESRFAFISICDFVHNFFICEDCRQHFYEMCSRVTSPFKKARDFALWLWSAHNEVNERLIKEEASLKTGDPKFPKIIWPPKQLCPSCYLSQSPRDKGNNQIDWDKDEVFKFLVGYYRNTLISLYNETSLLANVTLDDLVTSTNVVVVPIGAALAIAITSCVFGAVACYWRSRQKNRKKRRSWN